MPTTRPFVRFAAALLILCAVLTSACDDSKAPVSPTAPTTTTPPVTPPVAAAPTLTSVSPATATSGASSTVTLKGTGFVSGATVAVSGAGVSVSEVAMVDSTTITARLTIDRAADIGARTITVTTGGGTTPSQTLMINPGTPVVTNVSPASAPVGSTVNVTFTGSGFVPGATTVSVSGTGVTVLNVSVASADDRMGAQRENASGPMVAANGTSVTVRLAIDANATPGQRTVTVSSPGGATATFTFTVAGAFPTIGSFRANPVIITRGASSTLEWSGITNATTCSININIGTVPCANGSVVVSPTNTTEYMLTAIGPGGREWTYVTVNVEEPIAPPVVVIQPGSQTFTATGTHTFTVPAGVTQLQVTAFGARGGNGRPITTAGGFGARVAGTVTVVPGETLTILVGGAGQIAAAVVGGAGGAGGFNGGGNGGRSTGHLLHGGGGGGATEIRRGGTALMVAGGGGGGGGTAGDTSGVGGAGGQSGTAGVQGSSGVGGGGGAGATPVAGGAGGLRQGNGLATDGSTGLANQGGTGGNGDGSSGAGGGGGGGIFGGGGGGGAFNHVGGGAGGGSSMGPAGAVFTTGVDGANSGNGKVIITWP